MLTVPPHSLIGCNAIWHAVFIWFNWFPLCCLCSHFLNLTTLDTIYNHYWVSVSNDVRSPCKLHLLPDTELKNAWIFHLGLIHCPCLLSWSSLKEMPWESSISGNMIYYALWLCLEAPGPDCINIEQKDFSCPNYISLSHWLRNVCVVIKTKTNKEYNIIPWK